MFHPEEQLTDSASFLSHCAACGTGENTVGATVVEDQLLVVHPPEKGCLGGVETELNPS